MRIEKKMKKGTISYVITAFVGLLMIFADQLTKYLVSIKIGYANESISVIDNFFAIVHWHNTGAAWGIFSDVTIVLAIISIVCAGAIIFFYVQLDSAFYFS